METKEAIHLKVDLQNHPLLMLPVCVVLQILAGPFFAWGETQPEWNPAYLLAELAVRVFLFGGASLALWRLIVTRWATAGGLEYRVFGKVRKTIPWSGFRHVILGRSSWNKVSLLYLIPETCEPFSGEREDARDYLTRYHYKAVRLHPIKHNIAALQTFYGDVIQY